MATKKRILASLTDKNYEMQIFHFIDNSVDVTTISAIIMPTVQMVRDTVKMSSGNPVSFAALTLTCDVELTGSLNIWSMILKNDPNYDSLYSNVSGKQLLYFYLNDINNSKTYYFSLMDEGYEMIPNLKIGTLRLRFSDGLERTKKINQLKPDETKNTDWTSLFGTDSSTNLTISQIVEYCVTTYSKDNDLKTFSLTIDSTNYPIKFTNLIGTPVSKKIDEIYIDGSVLSYGTTFSDVLFETAFDLLTSICSDFQLIMISYGIGEFELKPLIWLGANQIQLNLTDFTERSIRIKKSTKRNQIYLDKFVYADGSDIDPFGYVDPISSWGTAISNGYQKTSITRELKLGSEPASDDQSNIKVYDGSAYQFAERCTDNSGTLTFYNDWSQTKLASLLYLQFITNLSPDDFFDAPAGMQIIFSIKDNIVNKLEFGNPYYFNLNGLTYKFFITKITSRLKTKTDEIEAVSIREYLYESF